MWYFMNNTPNVLTDTIEDGITKVKKGGYAYLMESSSIQYEVTLF